MLKATISSFIFVARSDLGFLKHTLPALVSMCLKAESEITVVVDSSTPSGVLAESLPQSGADELVALLSELKEQFPFEILPSKPSPSEIGALTKLHLGKSYKETHCFRGYPIVGSIKQFHDTEADYVLHLDCDMIFHEDPDYSWILDGVELMEENQDIACVLPKGGPPTDCGTLHQGTTDYKTDEKRGVYLFKNFTSRHYFAHRKRFLKLLPMQPLWLSWREPIKSRLFGNGKMLCWESIVEKALERSSLWRADLMTNKAWSLHPGERSSLFYELLPQIINSVENGKYPTGQKGHFDITFDQWKTYLHNEA
jgi:hypothetical protein